MVCLRTYERKDAHEHLQASQMLAHSFILYYDRFNLAYWDLVTLMLSNPLNYLSNQ